ncbi:MAG: DUF3467 domain-containing protein [Candidatus Cryptobacteroides sp.]
MEEKEKGFSLELDPEIAGGKYSNLALLSHSATEFYLDFAQMAPGFNKAKVCSRVIMHPEHAKRFLIALKDNVAKYEAQFGPINFTQQGRSAGATINLSDLMGGNNGSRS